MGRRKESHPEKVRKFSIVDKIDPFSIRQLQGDAYCEGCRYNLRGQVILKDEEADFPVCRCPECGRFHPAGFAIVPLNKWVDRLAAFVTGIKAATFLALFCLSALAIYSVEHVFFEAYHWNNNRGQIPYEPYGPAGPGLWSRFLPFLFINGAFSFGLGIFFATVLWRRKYKILLVILFCAAMSALEFFVWRQLSGAGNQTNWALHRAAYWGIFNFVLMTTGLALGLPLARFVARALFPPHFRQQCAFLWVVSNKRLPKVAPREVAQ
jgi:hypothetical protein